MSQELNLLSALLVGLLGGVHCVGMCGGIVGALSLGIQREGGRSGLPVMFAYNGGRLLSYTVAGGLMGGVGWIAAHAGDLRQVQSILQLVAGLFMVAMGLYLAGWWFGLARLERAGGVVWRRVEPVGRRLMPVRHAGQALVLGALWGWLPCGLVYSVLIWSISAGNALDGAALMLAFGIGTLPNLLAMGVAANRLAAFTRNPWVKRGAGSLVLAFGLYTLWLAVVG